MTPRCPVCGSGRTGAHVDVRNPGRFAWCPVGFDASLVVVGVEA